MTRIAAPALVVLVVVTTLLGLYGWNRSGEPRLVATLTERELPRQQYFLESDEDPHSALQIAADRRHDPLDSLNWLPESRLRAIGFPFNVTAGAPEAADIYAKTPARLAWVAFEMDGPAWRDIERRRALRAEANQERERRLESRLVPVDAGPELDELLARYPSGHVILKAVIGMNFLPPDRGGPLVYGTLREIIPSRVTVPSHLRPALEALAPEAAPAQASPRYEAEVAIGRLGVPYLRSLRPAQAAGAELRTRAPLSAFSFQRRWHSAESHRR
jgi:hypothetical protein